MPKNKKFTLSTGVLTNQILTNYDEVCNPSLSSILLAVFPMTFCSIIVYSLHIA